MSVFNSVRNLRVLYALFVYRTYVPQVYTYSTCIHRSLSLYITLSILISQVHSGMIRQGSIEKFSYVTIQKSARNGSELSPLSGTASNNKKQSKSAVFTRPAGAPILNLSKGTKARSTKDRVGDKATDHQDTPPAPFKQTPDLWLVDPPASSGLARGGHTGDSRSDPSPLAVLKEFMSVTNEEDQEGTDDDDDDDDEDDSDYDDEDEKDDELDKDKESDDSADDDEDDIDDEDDDETIVKEEANDKPLTRSAKNIPHSSINTTLNHSANKDTGNNYADDDADDAVEEEEGDDGDAEDDGEGNGDDLDEHEDYGEDVMFNNALSSSFAHKQPRSRGVKKLINRLIDEV